MNPLDDVLFVPNTEDQSKGTSQYKAVFENVGVPPQLNFSKIITTYSVSAPLNDHRVGDDVWIELSLLPSFLYNSFVGSDIPTLRDENIEKQMDVIRASILINESDSSEYFSALKTLSILGLPLHSESILTRDAYNYLNTAFPSVITVLEQASVQLNVIPKSIFKPLLQTDVLNATVQKKISAEFSNIFFVDKVKKSSPEQMRFSDLQYYLLMLQTRLNFAMIFNPVLTGCNLTIADSTELFNNLGIVNFSLTYGNTASISEVDAWFKHLLEYGVVINGWRHNFNLEKCNVEQAIDGIEIPKEPLIHQLHYPLSLLWLLFINPLNSAQYEQLNNAFTFNDFDSVLELISSMV